MKYDPVTIAKSAHNKRSENIRFRQFVKNELKLSDAAVDEIALAAQKRAFSRIDCLDCGNCCKSLQILVDNDDIQRLAASLNIPFKNFEKKYVRMDENREKRLVSPPCPFLNGNRCTVYEYRPKSCRDFPYLHESGLRNRLLVAIDNSYVCPIVNDTLENLKDEFKFAKTDKLR